MSMRRKSRAASGCVGPPEPSELQVHIALVSHLKVRAKPGVLYWHTPNGGMRTKSEASKLAAMGVLAGVPDLVLIASGRTYGLELKTSRGRLSSEQRGVLASFERAGAVTATAYGLDAALAILEAWGLVAPSAASRKAA